MHISDERLERLRPWFDEAQRRGFVGPGPLEPHITHALGFGAAIGEPPERLLDLGSGGGLPGLVLAAIWPTTSVVLLDATQKRSLFLTEAVEDVGWQSQVRVVRGRAEEVAREPAFRGRFEVVSARSFGPPPVVAECAAGFLAPGGRLVVSEPPDGDGSRWPTAGLAELGMTVPQGPVGGFQVILQAQATPDRYPRRVGIPAKRPLF